MSNYVTLWRQRPVCQFSWCPQRDVSLLWPVATGRLHFRPLDGYFRRWRQESDMAGNYVIVVSTRCRL